MTVYSIRNIWLRRAVIVLFVSFFILYFIIGCCLEFGQRMFKVLREISVDIYDAVKEASELIVSAWRDDTE